MRETWWQEATKQSLSAPWAGQPQVIGPAADDRVVTPSELAELMRSMGELTSALSAFVVVAENLYPRLRRVKQVDVTVVQHDIQP